MAVLPGGAAGSDASARDRHRPGITALCIGVVAVDLGLAVSSAKRACVVGPVGRVAQHPQDPCIS